MGRSSLELSLVVLEGMILSSATQERIRLKFNLGATTVNKQIIFMNPAVFRTGEEEIAEFFLRSEKYPSNFDFLGMAAKKVDALEERLEGEMNQIKETVEERMSSMEGQVADLRDMMKKMLEFQTQSAASDAKGPEAKNINSEIHREEEEVEIVDGRRGRPHLEPFQREERGGGYGERQGYGGITGHKVAYSSAYRHNKHRCRKTIEKDHEQLLEEERFLPSQKNHQLQILPDVGEYMEVQMRSKRKRAKKGLQNSKHTTRKSVVPQEHFLLPENRSAMLKSGGEDMPSLSVGTIK
ncbi:hypothetical protein M5K25_007254 [Dendrobium thyrsiflorum]|uniref:Uncharacterized protein n=1 Tax=Dendrobium thyrsiflorum TaxID=117978 RepID=A0ABD0VDP3_DENTH